MQFALPPRKTSHPPPYARNTSSHALVQRRRRQLQIVGYVILALLTLYLVVRHILLADADHTSAGPAGIDGPQDIVLVTVLDLEAMSEEYVHMVKTNRDHYAARHGYKTFYTNTSTYSNLVDPSPSSWSLIPALRHALTVHASSTFFWALSADALITNPTLSLEEHILQPLESLMKKDIPVVPPDSVIHTFSHLKPSRTHLILSQDMDNLAHTSFILRNTPFTATTTDNWAQYFLDAWFDPLYRAYAFQKAENHALEHLVQWHPTVLAKLVLIEQRRFNSYNHATPPIRDPATGVTRTHDSMWQGGDLVVNFKDCRDDPKRNCEDEMRQYFSLWEKLIVRLEGGMQDHNVRPAAPRKHSEGETVGEGRIKA